MAMFFLNVSDFKKSSKFYEQCLKALAYEVNLTVDDYIAFGSPTNTHLFWIHQADAPGGATKNMHIAFDAESREDVKRFFEAALKNGGSSNGEPGVRKEHGAKYYAAYVLDPDGNNIEAVCLK